ncbi:hypothetical protein AU490_01960 [Lonsdalea populi]|uniref:Uncharacterized protein n=1 Tax=Lonsdalea populi TaxID=1172565 RepID=A0A3N0USX6_9GAMM|nr:hypothetical protein AU486_00610 [Lonsdalea quercina]RAT30368.1 hypothetical protein AU490_01960 [Lonsdalea populi]RAT32888.1 hypothetical protein AU491_11405 [Lonsdalea populi]RAT48934.1 hypothetical protein AU496_02530 [Lonsdalea populi]RAT51310.1 hypothetical protein AU497_10825 [Lonsdalea populi]
MILDEQATSMTEFDADFIVKKNCYFFIFWIFRLYKFTFLFVEIGNIVGYGELCDGITWFVIGNGTQFQNEFLI